MIPILTGIIGLVAKGAASKAIAGGLGGLIIAASGPAVTSFQSGFSTGLGTSVEQLGLTLGQLIGGFIVGYVITWLSPKNATK